MEDTRPGYYAVIPADVRYDDSIPANAKLLYGEISALIGADGYCYAGNTYFAENYQMSVENIARLISKLEKAGHIKRIVIKDSAGQIVQRRLYLRATIPNLKEPENDVNTNLEKSQGGIDKKINTPLQKNQEGIDKKIKDINTSITNVEKENKKEKAAPLTDEQLKDLFIPWIAETAGDAWSRKSKNELYFALTCFYEPRQNKKQEPARTKAAFTALSNRLRRFSGGDPDLMVDMLERATTAGWKSVFQIHGAEIPTTSAPAAKRNEEWL